MSDNIILVVLLFIIYLGVPVVLLLALDWFRRPSKKKIEEYSREFTRRLLHPDFAAVEKHFSCPLPTCVKSLYADNEEVMRADFEITSGPDAVPEDRWFIAFYQPADGISARDNWPVLEKFFAFADDGYGNAYLIDPHEEDPAVLFHDHETRKMERVCDHFTEFMRWRRTTVKELDNRSELKA